MKFVVSGDVHGTFSPRSIDEFVALSRILPDLFDATRPTALNGHSELCLPKKRHRLVSDVLSK